MPLKKLQEIIIAYAQHLYAEGKYEAFTAGIKYPYAGPAFDFVIERDRLRLIDNTWEELQTPEGEDIRCPVNHGDFIGPKSNQIEAAFLKFKYWANKIYSARENEKLQYPDELKIELEIVKDKLMRLTIEMLKLLAESYSIREVDPEAGQVYWVYPGQQASRRDPETDQYHQLAAYGLGIFAGRLEIGDTAPADIQLKIEEFNDLLEETEKEIESCFNESSVVIHKPPYHPAREIVVSIQRLVHEWAQDVYYTRRAHAEHLKVKYPYDGPIVQFGWSGDEFVLIEPEHDPVKKSTIISPDGKILETRAIDNGFLIPKLTQIKNALLRFEFYRTEIEKETKENPGCAGITLIKDKLIPIASEILDYVSISYDFFDPKGDLDDEVKIVSGASPARVTNGKFQKDDSLPPAIALKIETLNYLIDKYQQKIDMMAAVAPRRLEEIFSVRGNDKERFPQQAEQPRPAPTMPTLLPATTMTTQWHELGKLRIRADFLEVQRGKQKWNLTLNQGKALEFVYKNHRANNSIHQRQVLRHIESPSARLRETFRSKKGLYAALFAKGEEKGHIQLNTL